MPRVNTNPDKIPAPDFEIETCALCGGKTSLVTLADYPIPAAPNSPAIVLHNIQLYKCENCEEGYFNPAQLKELDRKTIEAERELLGLLKAAEIRDIVESLGISKNRLEKILGINPRSFNRWEKNKSIQSPIADTLLRALRINPEIIRILAKEKGISLDVKQGRPPKRSQNA